MQRRSLATPIVAGILLAVSCAPPPIPGPADPVWTASYSGGPEVGGFIPQSIVLGSNSDWFITTDTVSGSSPHISFFPRTGAGNDELGTPQVHPGGQVGLADGFLGDHVLLSGSTPTSGGDLQFWLETGGTWSHAGTFAQPLDTQVVALTDTALVLRHTFPLDPELWVYDLSVSAGVISAALAATITAPAAWSSEHAQSFAAQGVALDGDVLAASSNDLVNGSPGRVAIYRDTGASWTLEDTLTGPSEYFGRGVAIDDAGTGETLAVGTINSSTVGSIETFTSTGASWSPLDVVDAPMLTDNFAGVGFGVDIAIDGDLMVAGVHEESLADTSNGTPRHVQFPVVMKRTNGSWSYEASLQPIADPLDPDDLSRGPVTFTIDGDHVAATNLVTLAAPCMFCLPVRAEAWRWERSNGAS